MPAIPLIRDIPPRRSGAERAGARPSLVVMERRRRWPALLAVHTARHRPNDDTWSALEYGCHVRDVFRIFDERLRLMLATDAPQFANWDQDVTAVDDRYDLQDPVMVSDELVAAGTAVAQRWDTVDDDQWQRTGDRSDGSSFTVETFARYFLHDPVHHLHDVAEGNRILTSG